MSFPPASDLDLADEWNEKFELFYIRDGDWIRQQLTDLYFLVKLSEFQLHQYLQEISRVILKLDILEHFQNPGFLALEFDFYRVFAGREEFYADKRERIFEITYNIFYSVLTTINAYQLYLSRFPNINYLYKPKTRICYRIKSATLEEITLIKFNPWAY